MQQLQGKRSKWLTRVYISLFIVALLFLIAGAIILAFYNRDSLPALLATIVGSLGTIFSFLPLVPKKRSKPQLEPEETPINIYNLLTLRALPLSTDLQSIQQRETVVKAIYAVLLESHTSAVVLTGMGGIGKSTLASLVLNHAERERRAGRGPFRRGPFRSEPLLLRINENTLFPELAANIFAAVGKSVPDLSSLPPQNQAYAVFNALNTANTVDTPRLIILDQFEYFLDQQTGRALTVQTGVGEFLDALNSQTCACRVLLTSRLRPHGTRDDSFISLRIYPIVGLDSAEGIALLRSKSVFGADKELRVAVNRCDGHALSLNLLITLLQTYQVSLATLLYESSYLQLWEGNIALNLLDRIFTNLLEPSRQLLCAFSVYREAVAIDAAQAIIPSITKVQALTTLRILLDQYLIQAQTTEGHYLLHPIVATYAQYHFMMNDEAANRQAKQAAHAKAAHYYLQVAATSCPPDDKRQRISDVQPFIEAVWQLAQAGQFQQAYELMERESLFDDLRLWGGNAPLLELCHLLLSEDWQCTQQQRALIYVNIASTSGVLGQRQEALKYYELALGINREVGDRRGEGATLKNLGGVYDDLGEKQEALKYYELALGINREERDRRGEGATLNNLGNVYNDLGEKQKALKYYELALDIRREERDRGGEGATLNNLGLVYDDLGEKQKALKYYELALDISREERDRGGEGTTLNNLGKVYNDLEQKQEALKYYELALGIRREVGDRRGEGATLNNLGLVYDDLGEKQEALKHYEQALGIRREVGDRAGEGITLHNMGMIYASQSRYEVALACILLAKVLFERVQSPSDVDDQVQWIAGLRKSIGEEQFVSLLARVEPHAEQIVGEMLRNGLSDNS